MKRILPYILIAVIVLQLFAPFSVGLDTKNNLAVVSNKAEALIGIPSTNGISVGYTPSATDKSITIEITVFYTQVPARATKEGVRITKTDPVSKIKEMQELSTSDTSTFSPTHKNSDGYDDTFTGSVTFSNLTEDTEYSINIDARQLNTIQIDLNSGLSLNIGTDYWANTEPIDKILFIVATDIPVKTNPEGVTEPKIGETGKIQNENMTLPICALNNIGGCVGIVLYRLVFQPSSYLFAITGKLLDYTLFYSIQDTSYRSQFVVEGWGIVRDFCNMFFIFILLYIAIGTMLNLSGVKTKEMIISVVLIGLFINFSLFATQVIIDASNILTRVFYNQIVVGPKVKGVVVEELGLGGSKQLTAALVKKINPQQLIIKAGEAGKIPAKGVSGIGDEGDGKTKNPSGVSNGTFIMVTIMASILNIVGLWCFFLISMVFIARVVGLWMAMILAPVAFFSYTVPKLQDIDMIGWKKWWPETIKLAFLAPVFMFFLYIIIQFLDSGLGVLDANGKAGLDFFIAIIVPFAFLMVLLTKAKDVTTKMSGTIGEKITNGIKTAGALALGGTALGTAAIGKRVIGQTMAKASQGNTSSQLYSDAMRLKNRGDSSAWDSLTMRQKIAGGIGSRVGLTSIYGKVARDPNGNKVVVGGIGKTLNKAQKETTESNESRKKSDDAVEKAGYQGKEWEGLSGAQQTDVKIKYGKENSSKFIDLAEKNFRDVNGLSTIDPATKQLQALDPGQKEQVKEDAKMLAQKDLEKALKQAAAGVNAFTRVISKANTGSYDVRKLSTVTSDKRASIFSKIPVALIGAVAAGVRGGMKNLGLSNGSVKIEGKFMKDLGSVISDSLKTMKINVDLSGIGATKSTAKDK